MDEMLEMGFIEDVETIFKSIPEERQIALFSATLPPALVQGLFLAYRAGREEFQRHRGEPGTPLAVCCAWFDEFGSRSARHGAAPDNHPFDIFDEGRRGLY